MPPQLTPAQQQAQLIAAKDRERADNSRFASNLVYSRTADQQPQQPQPQSQTMSTQYDHTERQAKTNLVDPQAEKEQEETRGGYKRPLEANIDSAAGQPYLVYEGSVLDTVLMNRLDGDAVGPVKVLVSNPLYSHDHQHVIIPEGTVVLGEAKKIGAAGTEYSACSRSARNNFSGAIDGRPVFAYSLLNRGCSSLNASSVMTRRGRKGWSCGTRCSGLT